MSTSTIGDLLKPPSSPSIDSPEVCDNCARDLYVIREQKVLCHDCDRISDPGLRIWKCSCCGTYRVWGLDSPVDTSLAKLNCLRCEEITEHRFVYVTRRKFERVDKP